MSSGRAFWLVGDRAGCHTAPCVQMAENMREIVRQARFPQVKGMSADICKTVGLAYVGSNLLAGPAARYHDLGAGYHASRIDTGTKVRNHVRQLEALGYTVALTQAA